MARLLTTVARWIFKPLSLFTAVFFITGTLPSISIAAEAIRIGLNYPVTGRYKQHGFAQAEGAILAVEEINRSGGLLGRPLELLTADTAFEAERAADNVSNQIEQGAQMVFGGLSSEAARAAGKQAARSHVLYFATQASANEITGVKGHRHIFRESISSHMAANAIGHYLTDHFAGKKFFYITASDSWGFSAESSMRMVTGTKDSAIHQSIPVQYPKPSQKDLENALAAAANSDAEILVLIQYGKDLATTLQIARSHNLQERFTLVVPLLDLETAREIGAGALEGVIGAMAWNHDVPAAANSDKTKRFVDHYIDRFQHYPSAGAASAYNVVYQYADAVRRAGSTDTDKVINSLEDFSYSGLKGEQKWRAFDHQNLQTVYVVKGRQRADVVADRFKENFFEIVGEISGDTAAIPYSQWADERKAAGQPLQLD